MSRRGLGTTADLVKADLFLAKACELADHSGRHFSIHDLESELRAVETSNVSNPEIVPNARKYLSNIQRNALAAELLDRCGGPVPPSKNWPGEFIFISNVDLPKADASVDIRSLESTPTDGIGSAVRLGYLEVHLGKWIVSSAEGMVLSPNYDSVEVAANALAQSLNCQKPLKRRWWIRPQSSA